MTELRAFEAAARRQSFKGAAAELGVTPTAISHQIRLLEQHCGQPLFRRRPRPGLEGFADALAGVRAGSASGRLRVTAINAFAARLLVSQLPVWRKQHPRLRLDVIGTDAVLDLKAGEADVAVRYAREPPPDLASVEIARDSFCVVGSPSLVGSKRRLMAPSEITEFPLIECEWPPWDVGAPTWRRWEMAAREKHRTVPSLAGFVGLSFREELHAIEAVVSGQGIGIFSTVLVGRELADGALLRVSDIGLPGYGFFVVQQHHHPKKASIAAFSSWMRAAISM